MELSYYKSMEPFWGTWRIKKLIGEGSFGKVFEIEREDFGRTYKAAMKVITIPQSESEFKSILADGMDLQSATSYYKSFVEEVVDEFALMANLKGNSNIVSYEDHTVIEHKDGVGWDILIRMELLTPLLDYTSTERPMERKDVIKLGIDICKALEYCQRQNIIHRDIKPENIFVSPVGDYKLGDFGIARTVEKTTSGLSRKGTYTYMAPEVYKGETYDATVDIYSLGIVLYRLLNRSRTPFLPEFPAPISHSDRENSIAKRVGGAPLPLPVEAKDELGEIVLKACAYLPKDRYGSPEQMRRDLEALGGEHLGSPVKAGVGFADAQRELQQDMTLREQIQPEQGTLWEKSRTEEGTAGQLTAQTDATVSMFGTVAGNETPGLGQNEKKENTNGEDWRWSATEEDATVSMFGDTTGREKPEDNGGKKQGTIKEHTETSSRQETVSDEKKPKKNKFLLIGGIGAAAVVIAVCVFFLRGGNSAAPAVSKDYSDWTPISDEADKELAKEIENAGNDAGNAEAETAGGEEAAAGIEGENGLLADSQVGYFNELLFGRYEIQGGTREKIQDFLTDMQFEYDENREIELSVLPIDLSGNSANQDYSGVIISYSGEDFYRDTRENQGKLFADMAISNLGYEDKEKAEAFYEENIAGKMDNIDYTLVDKEGGLHGCSAYYSIADGKLTIYNAVVNDSGELTLKSVEYDISRENYTFQLSRNGLSVTMLPKEFGGGEFDEPVIEGYASSPEDVYQGIYYIGIPEVSGDKAEVFFADGKIANNASAEFSDVNTVTVSWESKQKTDENGESTVDEAGSVTFRYIPSTDVGFILIGSDGVYKYQKTYDQYFYFALGENLDASLSENGEIDSLDEASLRQLLAIRSNIQTKLIAAFEEQGISVTVDQGAISLDSSILFGFDEAELSDEGKAFLDAFTQAYGTVLREAEGHLDYIDHILVEGYTDSTGDDTYNLALSEKRAQAVADYCRNSDYMMVLYLETRGGGSSNLIYDENGKEDSAASRRVEFKIVYKIGPN